VLQCVVVYCSVLQCVTMCDGVLKSVVVYCKILEHTTTYCNTRYHISHWHSGKHFTLTQRVRINLCINIFCITVNDFWVVDARISRHFSCGPQLGILAMEVWEYVTVPNDVDELPFGDFPGDRSYHTPRDDDVTPYSDTKPRDNKSEVSTSLLAPVATAVMLVTCPYDTRADFCAFVPLWVRAGSGSLLRRPPSSQDAPSW